MKAYFELQDAKRRAREKNMSLEKFRKQNLLMNKLKKTQEECQRLNDELEILEEKVKNLIQEEVKYENKIIEDLVKHSKDEYHQFSQETISLAMEINTISPKAYKLLIDKLGFPEQHVIERTVNGVIDRYPKMLTDIDKVGEIVSDYKSANAVKGTLDACLAVDALYFTPNVRINELGEIDGIDPNTEFFVGKKGVQTVY